MSNATAQAAYAVRTGDVDGHRGGLRGGQPYAQVFAPAGEDVVCFEPMTAPTDALRGCFRPPPAVPPGACFRARFRISVERTS
jgi:galactose mutarotase-like enzyme